MVDSEGGKNASRSKVPVRMLLLGASSEVFIGQFGQNFDRVSRLYNVNIQLSSGETTDRVFCIDGSLENCYNVVQELLSSRCLRGPYQVDQNTENELNLLIQTDSIGKILGKGGLRIKGIRDATNAKIKVYRECLPSSSERVVAIGGNNEYEVICALKQILNIVKNLPTVSSPTYYVPSNNYSNASMETNRMSNAQKTWRDNGQNGTGNIIPGGYNTGIGLGYGTYTGNEGYGGYYER